jgi:endonuclease III
LLDRVLLSFRADEQNLKSYENYDIKISGNMSEKIIRGSDYRRKIVDDKERIVKIVKTMAAQPVVMDAVIKSHDENPWWPMAIEDWRMRMIIAGLSTRVSFRMLHTYQDTIRKFEELGYERIKSAADRDLAIVLKPLGLVNGRLKFLRNMVNYLETYRTEEDFFRKSSQDIINEVSRCVGGASFKIGQYCVLYAKGYYCGVMPVDSGMRDMLAPCLGLETGKKAYDHEVVRLQIEQIAKDHDWLAIAQALGYDGRVKLPRDMPLTWWLHLVLINYKRYFCNSRKPEQCPLLKICELNVGCR